MDTPNLLVIHTDQQSCWSLSSYGGTLVDTPHIDSLAEQGAILTNFFANTAVCTPCRGCFITGRYPHAHGAYQNNIPLNRDEVTFAQVLLDQGYETGYAGKWHLDGTPRPGWVHPDRGMGFSDNYYMFNRGHWKKIEDNSQGDVQPTIFEYGVTGDETTYPTDWLAEKVIDFVSRDRDKPFCHMVSIPDPHGPFHTRPPYSDMYDPADMPLPDTLHKDDHLPGWAKAARGAPSDDRLKQSKAWYCGEVKLIDDCVGRMLDALREKGILDDTVVVFTSDHGEYMGEHGLMGKNQLYETAHRVPMLIRWPEKIAAGTQVDQCVSTVDFQSTILGLMGFEKCGREQGHDASSLLTGENTDWEDLAYIHHSSLERAGIFTPDYQLAFVKDQEHILFDRKNDPDQLNNLFLDVDHQGVVKELTEQVVAHNENVDAPATRWLKAM